MVAKVTVPQSIKRALNYNEQKVLKGQAECIYAHSFLKEAGDLNFYDKLELFTKLNELNQRATTNTLHVSLNFDPSEKLGKAKLNVIAQTYMDKIGFGDQPYLVYAHHDAGHPHIHIVSTAIKNDGKRISLHSIGRNESETARKEIEKEFKLIKAQQTKTKSVNEIAPVNVLKAQYGKAETKRSIQNVLDVVINQYKYTSLAELNAILRQYNVTADRGSEKSIMYRSKGLVYRLLDANGNKIGVPIKASLIYNKPTLDNLEKRFEENEKLRIADKPRLKTSIEWAFTKSPLTIEQFIHELQKEKIQTVLRQNKDGIVYGITFIDYRTKSVFNGSDLGKQFSIAGLMQRLQTAGHTKEQIQIHTKPSIPAPSSHEIWGEAQKKVEQSSDKKEGVLKGLLHPEKTFHHVPYELLRKKKRKRNL